MHEQRNTSKNTYLFDPESAAEMARLILMDQMVTEAMGGLFAERERLLPAGMTILDLACGPGGWVTEVARTFPSALVRGVDVSQLMIQYATALAKTRHVHNASFAVMDLTQPLEYPDDTFDLINGRFLVGVLGRERWASLLAECLRVLRPGGILRLTETDGTCITSSPMLHRLTKMLMKTMQQLGYGFSVHGEDLGITPRLGTLVSDAGFHEVRQRSFHVDFSAWQPAHLDVFHQAEVIFFQARSLIVGQAQVSEEELSSDEQQMLAEMMQNTFTGIWYGLTVWASKPLPPVFSSATLCQEDHQRDNQIDSLKRQLGEGEANPMGEQYHQREHAS